MLLRLRILRVFRAGDADADADGGWRHHRDGDGGVGVDFVAVKMFLSQLHGVWAVVWQSPVSWTSW